MKGKIKSLSVLDGSNVLALMILDPLELRLELGKRAGSEAEKNWNARVEVYA